MNKFIRDEHKITLIGPPNSGKSTLYNFLGSKEVTTVNYPGSTVDFSLGKIQKRYNLNADLIDTPGIISLFPSSLEEKITIENIFHNKKYGIPDVLILTVDGSQLTRHLLLAKQISQLGLKMIIVVTMNDILYSKGLVIDVKCLSEFLNCTVLKFNGRTGKGIEDLINELRNSLISSDKKTYEIGEIKSYESYEIIHLYEEIEVITNKCIRNIAASKVVNEKFNTDIKILNNSNAINLPDGFTLKIDKIVLHKYWGPFVFISIVFIIFASIFWLSVPLMDGVDLFFSSIADNTSHLIKDEFWSSFLSNGVISGTGSVMIFLPQIVILFLFIGFLEDSGYLARGAMLIDKPLSKIGLNGRSFIPMLSGFACAIPAIMATRTITKRSERLKTIFIIPLMSCSARIPLYGLLISFLFYDNFIISGIIFSLLYFTGIIVSVIILGVIGRFKQLSGNEKDLSSFVIELPSYRFPSFKNIIFKTYNSSKNYIKKAGPVIIIFSILLWFLTNYPKYDNRADNQLRDNSEMKYSQLSNSYAFVIGKSIEPILQPLGFDWRIGISLISSLAAREVFVSTLALVLKVPDNVTNDNSSLMNAMKNAKNEMTGKQLFTFSTSIGLLIFYIFALQCISTFAISKKESGGWTLPIIQFLFYGTLAYVLSYLGVTILKLAGFD